MKQEKDTSRQAINKEAQTASFDAGVRRKQVKDFERFITPFFSIWNEGIDVLPRARSFIPEQDRASFDKLVNDFKQSGNNLNVYLRSLRLRMQKGK